MILFVLLTIPFFQIDFLVANVEWAGKAYALLQILAGLVILFLLIKDRMIQQIPKFYVLFAALLFVMVLASAVNGAGLKRAIEYSAATMLLCLLMDYGVRKDLRSFLRAEILFFGLLTVINFLTVVLFPEGLYRYLDYYKDTWFLGFKSGHIVYQIAFLFFLSLYVWMYNKRIVCCIYIADIFVYASAVLVKNRSAMVILLLVILLSVVPQLRRFTWIFNILSYTGLSVLLNLLFVVFRRMDLFAWLIQGIFHRRMDLTHRTDVWDKAFQAILERPVIGHGYQTFVFSDSIETTHNEYLEILYKTGIIGLIIFTVILVFVIIRLYKNRKEEMTQWVALFTGAMFLFFVLEQYAFVYFFYFFIFAYYAKDLRNLKQVQNQRFLEKARKKKEDGRIVKSARNFIFTICASLSAILIGLIAQRLFLRILGLEYAGLNGLFTNVIAMLSIADLGIGEAVVFNLYRPLQEHDHETVASLMRFYRKAFLVVAGVVAVIGAGLIPFLPYIAKTTGAIVNTTVIYLIFLLDVVLSYVMSYKRAILYADQKNFYISIIHMIYLVSMNAVQLIVLYATHSYYVYLLSKVVFRVLENLVITCVANRQYPWLKQRAVSPLRADIRADIRKKTGALLFHKIGSFVVNGTDNILISIFFNLTMAGLYSNYYLVIDALTKLFNPALAALTPSVGNLLVTDSKEHVFAIFRRIRFLNFWISCFVGTSLLVLIQPFIRLWFGPEYLLDTGIVIVLALQFFQLLMRGTYNSFQDAAGIFYENRFVPLVESAMNLVASIVLLKLFGLGGIFAGTIVSSLALWAFSYPKYIYSHLFQRSIKNYILETAGYLGVFVAVAAVTAVCVHVFNGFVAADGIILLIADAALCFVISNGLMALCFFRNDCMKYYMGLLVKAGKQI